MTKSEILAMACEEIQAVLIESGFDQNQAKLNEAFIIASAIKSAESSGEVETKDIIDYISQALDRLPKRSTIYNYLRVHKHITDTWGSLEACLENHKLQKALTLQALYIEIGISEKGKRAEAKETKKDYIKIPIVELDKLRREIMQDDEVVTSKRQKEVVMMVFNRIKNYAKKTEE